MGWGRGAPTVRHAAERAYMCTSWSPWSPGHVFTLRTTSHHVTPRLQRVQLTSGALDDADFLSDEPGFVAASLGPKGNLTIHFWTTRSPVVAFTASVRLPRR